MKADDGIEVTAQNLAHLVCKMKEHLGPELINIVLEENDITQQRGLLNHHRARAKAHPLAALLIDLENEVARSEETGILQVGFQSIILIERLLCVIAAKNAGFWADLSVKLLNPSQFYSTLFEAEVWKWYRSISSIALMLPEGNGSAPDLEIVFDECSIFIECKSLQDAPVSEKNSWNELSAAILKILRRNRRWWRIKITLKERMQKRDISDIQITVQTRSKIGDTSPIYIDGRVLIESEVITTTDLLLPAPLSIMKKGDLVWMEGDALVDEARNAFYKCPRIVEISPHYDLNPERQILNIIKTASMQMPDNVAGIIHIEIPYRDGDEIISVIDNLYNTVYYQIQRNFRRINAVVFSAKHNNNSPRDSGDAINQLQIIIPNHHARTKLSDTFRIFGSSDGKSKIEQIFFSLGSEGTIYGELRDIPSIEFQIGRSIIYLCSYDGQNQLKIWRDYKSMLVIEIIKPELGRRRITSLAPTFCNLPISKFAITWDKFSFRAAIDGNILYSE